MRKRLLSWLLATTVSIMQLLPSVSMIVYADDEGGTVITASSVSGKPNDTVEIDLAISNNPGINAFGILVDYNTDVLECTDIIYKDCLKNIYDPMTVPPADMTISGFRIGWAGGNSKVGSITRFTGNEAFCTVQFKIKETANNGEYEIALSQATPNEIAKYDDDGNIVSVSVTYTSGKITVTDSSNKEEYSGEIPSVPTISNITSTGFDIDIPQENEYTYFTSEITDFLGCTWHTDRTVSGLLPNTTYYVYQRVAETTTTKPSPASVAAEVTTEKYNIKDVIESVSIGNNGTVNTVLKPVIKYKTGFDISFLGNISYAWKTNNPDIDPTIAEAETYTITADDVINKRELSVLICADNCSDVKTSNSVTAGKRNYDEAIDGPILSATVTKTADGFTIAAMDGYEYVISETAAVPTSAAWDDLGSDVTVTGKAPGSTWYVFTRVKETDTVNASEPSVPVSVKIPSNNSALLSLSVSNGVLNPSFDAATTDYTVIIPYGVNVPTVSAVKQDSDATISINQASDFGDNNKATVTVTAEDGTETVYTVTFVERSVLSALSVNGVTISDFSPNKLDYTYSIPYANWLAEQGKVYIISASANNSSEVSVSENDFILNGNYDAATEKSVTITVTAGNGDETVYTVKFVVEACPHTNRVESTSKYPTCTELGEKETVCSVCGKQFGIEEIPALGHDFDSGEIIADPTCADMGTIRYQCSRCNESFTRTIPALGHRWGDVTVDTPATCTTDGESSRHCQACGAIGNKTLIPATGHSFGAWTKVDETTYERICAACGKRETKNVTVIDHDHIFNGRTEPVTAATCQTTGSQNVYCSVEGCTEFVTETIFKTAHIPAETVTENATCTTAGSCIVNCVVCGTKLSEEELPATGHSFTNYIDTATCTLPGIKTAECDNGCGTSDTVPTPAKGHTYGEWDKNAAGHWHECSVCHYTTEIIGHTEDGGVTTIEPTETTDGVKTYSCTECRYVIRTEKIEKPTPPTPDHTVHTFGTRWNSDSTYHWHECTICGEHSDASQHNEYNVEDTVEPTATTSGIRTYSCSICGYAVRTETIPPTDPNPPYPVNPTPSYPTVAYTTNTKTGKEPYIYGDTSKSGWDTVISEIDITPDGSTVRINMNGTTELPQTVVSRIQNRDINLELNMSNTVWTINGLDVTNPKTVNMRVSDRYEKIPDSVMDGLYSELNVKQLRLYHNGSFGFTANLSLNVGKKYDGYYATLYYYNTKMKQLEYSGQSYVSGGITEFEFIHASYYAIGFSSEPLYDDVSSGAGVIDFGTLVDVDSPVTNGVRIPQATIPRGFRLSNKKRKYRILKKRRLDDLVFVL